MNVFETTYFFHLSTFVHASIFKDSIYPWQALSKISTYLQTDSLGDIKGVISPNAYLIYPELISIGEGTVVEPGAYIQGPCIIGKNCVVRHGAYVRGNVITGDHCVIGHDSEIKNSIFLNGVHAAHFAYVGDSILGHDVNLGAGTKCANLRIDRGIISVYAHGQRISTNLKKFGAIIGDRAQIGCNVVTNPGTLLGKDVNCYPCLNFGGFVPSKSVVKSEIKVTISPL